MPDALQEFAQQTIKELLQELPPEKRLEGLSPAERIKGLSPNEVLAAMSPEARAALAQLLREQESPNPGGK